MLNVADRVLDTEETSKLRPDYVSLLRDRFQAPVGRGRLQD